MSPRVGRGHAVPHEWGVCCTGCGGGRTCPGTPTTTTSGEVTVKYPALALNASHPGGKVPDRAPHVTGGGQTRRPGFIHGALLSLQVPHSTRHPRGLGGSRAPRGGQGSPDVPRELAASSRKARDGPSAQGRRGGRRQAPRESARAGAGPPGRGLPAADTRPRRGGPRLRRTAWALLSPRQGVNGAVKDGKSPRPFLKRACSSRTEQTYEGSRGSFLGAHRAFPDLFWNIPFSPGSGTGGFSVSRRGNGV